MRFAIVCPSCGGGKLRNLDVLLHKRPAEDGSKTTFVTGCRLCGLVFSNPQPPQDHLENYYSRGGVWANKAKLEKRGRPPNVAARKNKSSLFRVLSRFANRAGGGAILDFGCGKGHALDLMRDVGWATYGIDPATAHLFATKGHAALDRIPVEPSFDLIVMNHVLEHVPDPLGILKSAKKAINPGGFIYVGTPSLDGLPDHGLHSYCINPHQHISAFTRQSMTNLLALAGFAVVEHPNPDKPQLQALLAVSDDHALPVDKPLSDARWAFLEYRFVNEGALGLLPSGIRRKNVEARARREHRSKKSSPVKKKSKRSRKRFDAVTKKAKGVMVRVRERVWSS